MSTHRNAVPKELFDATSSVRVVDLAKWLAAADVVMGATSSVSRFCAVSEKRWTDMAETYRAKWVALAASLLGVAPPREVRRGFGLDGEVDF
jgi:hypothetical protein